MYICTYSKYRYVSISATFITITNVLMYHLNSLLHFLIYEGSAMGYSKETLTHSSQQKVLRKQTHIFFFIYIKKICNSNNNKMAIFQSTCNNNKWHNYSDNTKEQLSIIIQVPDRSLVSYLFSLLHLSGMDQNSFLFSLCLN